MANLNPVDAQHVVVPATIPVTDGFSGGASGKVTLTLHDAVGQTDIVCTYVGIADKTYGSPTCTSPVKAGDPLTVTHFRLRLNDGLPQSSTDNASRVELTLQVSACGCISGGANNDQITILPADTVCDDKQSCDGLGTCVGCNAAGNACQPANACKTGTLQACTMTNVRPHCAESGNQPAGTACGTDQTCDGNGNCCMLKTWHLDADGDGFGGPMTKPACDQPVGYVLDGTDCNDADKRIHPGAPEVCDGVDDNCNGMIDEGGVCPAGCFGKRSVAMTNGEPAHAYMICGATSWFAAEQSCGTGMELAKVDNGDENTFLIGMSGGEAFWIGANDIVTEGDWIWTDKTPVVYSNWASGQPANVTGNEDCGLVNGNNGRWHARRCAALHPYICEEIL